MEVIKANPQNISEIFQKQYIIPEYQRPYAWDEDQCNALWDDLADAFDTDTEAEYFLGTIVLVKDNNSKKDIVIDGQQRLTSLLILMKALTNHHEYKLLNRSIYIHDPKTDARSTKEFRIESCVIAEDKKELGKILDLEELVDSPDKEKPKPKLFQKNYDYFNDKITEWKKENPEKIEKFIEYILNNVKLLPIDCGKEESALKIFETLNDRGTPLNEADIFKSKLYSNLETEQEKEEFIEFWKELEDPLLFFRIYMHILRAQKQDTSNERNLRDYFSKILKDKAQTKTIIEDIKKIQLAHNFLHNKIDYWRKMTLNLYPTDNIIIYPYYVYMFKYAAFEEETQELELSKTHIDKLVELLKALIRFIYIRGVIYRTLNAIKYDIFKACVAIYNSPSNNFFPKTLFLKPSDEEKRKFIDALRDLTSSSRYARGVLGLYHALNTNQLKECEPLDFSKYHVEHILPRVWQHYDGWTKESYDNLINSLGNLSLLEAKLNIKAKNEYLERKQVEYKKSEVKDVFNTEETKDTVLSQLSSWTAEQCEKRQNEIADRVISFLFNS